MIIPGTLLTSVTLFWLITTAINYVRYDFFGYVKLLWSIAWYPVIFILTGLCLYLGKHASSFIDNILNGWLSSVMQGNYYTPLGFILACPFAIILFLWIERKVARIGGQGGIDYFSVAEKLVLDQTKGPEFRVTLQFVRTHDLSLLIFLLPLATLVTAYSKEYFANTEIYFIAPWAILCLYTIYRLALTFGKYITISEQGIRIFSGFSCRNLIQWHDVKLLALNLKYGFGTLTVTDASPHTTSKQNTPNNNLRFSGLILASFRQNDLDSLQEKHSGKISSSFFAQTKSNFDSLRVRLITLLYVSVIWSTIVFISELTKT